MDFTIEKAYPEDRKAILKVLEPWNMHRVPSPGVEDIDFSSFFVAKLYNQIVGVAGYKILDNTHAKTRLLAVFPELQGSGIGKALQDKRLMEMYTQGIRTVITDADRPDTVIWYKKYYGYREVERRKKTSTHGLASAEFTTILELDLDVYMKNKDRFEDERLDYMYHHDAYPLSPYPPLIINVALTGMVPSKISTPFVPISVEEIVEDAIAVCDAGASLVHLHARDNEGKPSSSTRYYEDILTQIKRERPHLICCVTTSGRGGVSLEDRSEVLYLKGLAKPDMASLTLGSLNFLSGPSVNSLETIQQLAMKMKENNIKPELEVFDLGMINIAKYLERHGILQGKKYFNILLGNINTATATLKDIVAMTSSLPENSLWAIAGLGTFQLPMNMASIVAGGHVRVGIEDNIYYDISKNKLATNKELVERLVRISQELGRTIATPSEARRMIGL